MLALAFNVTAVGDVTVSSCDTRFVEPAGDVSDTVLGLIVRVPPPPPVPTVSVTFSVCEVPPLIENNTCPV